MYQHQGSNLFYVTTLSVVLHYLYMQPNLYMPYHTWD